MLGDKHHLRSLIYVWYIYLDIYHLVESSSDLPYMSDICPLIHIISVELLRSSVYIWYIYLDTNHLQTAPHRYTSDIYISDICHLAGAPQISIIYLIHLARRTSPLESSSDLWYIFDVCPLIHVTSRELLTSSIYIRYSYLDIHNGYRAPRTADVCLVDI